MIGTAISQKNLRAVADVLFITNRRHNFDEIKELKAGLNEMIRKLEDKQVPKYASAEALQLFYSMKQDTTLYLDDFRFRKTKDKSTKDIHKLLKYDHLYPVPDILKISKEVDDTTVMYNLLHELLGSVWITKEEDKLLPSKDRYNPIKSYENAGIELYDLSLLWSVPYSTFNRSLYAFKQLRDSQTLDFLLKHRPDQFTNYLDV